MNILLILFLLLIVLVYGSPFIGLIYVVSQSFKRRHPKRHETKTEKWFHRIWKLFSWVVVISVGVRLYNLSGGLEYLLDNPESLRGLFNLRLIIKMLMPYLPPFIIILLANILVADLPKVKNYIKSNVDKYNRRKYDKYLDVLNGRVSIPLAELAKIVAVPLSQVEMDLQKIMKLNYLPTAYINHATQELIIKNVMNQKTVMHVVVCSGCGGKYSSNETVSTCKYCGTANS